MWGVSRQEAAVLMDWQVKFVPLPHPNTVNTQRELVSGEKEGIYCIHGWFDLSKLYRGTQIHTFTVIVFSL